MGKSMNLNNLSPEEAQQILKVIQKDFELRQKERERLSKIEEVVNEEENKTELLTKQQKFNENCCIRCCQTFGFIFNRKQLCQSCRLYICKSCAKYDDNIKGYVCKACLNELELKHKSLDWFYNNVSRKYKRFGSAKVVRTLYKHADGSRVSKFHWSDGDEAVMEEPEHFDELDIAQDNESDSGYDPSLYSSFGQSGSLRVKTRPALKSVFPEIKISDEHCQEIDNSLFSPPPPLGQISPRQTNGTAYNNNNDASPDTSLESIQISTQTTPVPHPRMATTPTQTIEDLDSKEQEKRDIYKEAFESTKRTEEAKFKVRFDNLLQDMQQSFEALSPRDGQVPSGYGSTSYGDLMTTYRGRVKDLLVSLSQRLELAVESFDETCAHNPGLTSLKVKQMISKLVEDRLGESLDLTSDEAVSDLSSLSDDSGEQKSLEDQIAQAVIARVLELHRNQTGVHLDLVEPADNRRNSESSGSEVKTVVRSRDSSVSEEPNIHEMVPNEHILHKGAKRLDRDSNWNESDINANINDRSKWAKTERHEDYKNENDTDGEVRISGRQSPHETFDVFEDDVIDGEHTQRDRRKRLHSDDIEPGNQRLGVSSGHSESDNERRRSSSGENRHRKHDSELENYDSNKARPRLGSGVSETDDKEDEIILKQEFEKLRTFAREVVPRPLYEEAKFVEEIEPEPIEESMECVKIDHEESQEEFSSRFFTYDKVHDSEHRGLPDFSDLDYEYHDFGLNEVDPDLLSMNLAPILEETEEELAEEEIEDEDAEYEQDWRGNWIFKGAGGMAPYNNISSKNRLSAEFGDGYVMVPKPNEILAPQIGNRDVDDMSDLSENENRDLSDEESSFYARTSEEIARITRKTSSSTQASALANISIQTEGESDAESIVSRPNSSFSDSGFRGNKPEQYSFDSRVSEKSVLKLSEELVPAEGDDPKFEIPPDSLTISEGELAKLTCRVAGTQPIDVFWYKVREEVEELENSENYEIIKDGSRQSINMYNMTKADAGQYMCMAINEKGRCCQYLILNVKKNTTEMKAPEFLKTLSDVEIKEGQSVKFRCKVKGIPQPRVVWYKDGKLLLNQLNYRLERFGNRDYILAIDSATMDEDAEYCALAKNVAGEARSSAQLIVEPRSKPESVPVTAKSPKSEKSDVKKKTESDFPDLSYLGLGRSKSSARSAKSSPSSPSVSLSSNKMPKSPKDKNNDSELHNLSERVAMTRESVSDVAEDILSSSKELTEIDKSIAAMDKLLEDLESDVYSVNSDDAENNNGVISTLPGSAVIEYSNQFYVMQGAAENVRKATKSTLDYLNNTDAYVMREKGVDDVATSTPRNSDTERVFNPDSDASHIVCDTSDVTMETSQDTSNDSQKSEILFNLNPMTINMGNTRDVKQKVKSGRRTYSRSSSNEDTSVAKDNKESQHNDTLQTDKHTVSDTSCVTHSPDVSMDATDLNITHDSSGDILTVNLGPKRENKQRYQRDFYIIDTPIMQRKASELSPREETQRAHTEEKIYLAASTVTHLENKVMSLQDKMKAVNALQEKDRLGQIENEVAQTVAHVASSEKQVKHIEGAVSKLADSPKGKVPSTKSRQAPSIPRQKSPPREKPEPTYLIGDTKEQDLPESRTEFNEEYGSIELPSVNRLKAMFGGIKSDDRDSSIKRVQSSSGPENDSQQEPIHSITARSVSKEQLEKLRHTTDDPRARVTSSSEVVHPGRATALMTGQQIKPRPNMPKQVYQSHDFRSDDSTSIKMQAPKQSIQVSSNVKQTPDTKSNTKSQTIVKISLGSGNINRPLSPSVADHVQTHQPIKSTVTAKTGAPKHSSQSVSQNMKTGDEIDTPEERKSPKIKTGAISAMSKFWEKGAKDDKVPELLEYD
ncbi:titin homolog isoform X2 [Mercenaria mercenaria]|uniref:titin homolog isoform X2 n=1 Tax=Mercenaria mercenaria TaxID=6596 RepID=UPI00234E43A8|nr:titin homolog isoform X2 [Mercenaria mercenaria]